MTRWLAPGLLLALGVGAALWSVGSPPHQAQTVGDVYDPPAWSDPQDGLRLGVTRGGDLVVQNVSDETLCFVPNLTRSLRALPGTPEAKRDGWGAPPPPVFPMTMTVIEPGASYTLPAHHRLQPSGARRLSGNTWLQSHWLLAEGGRYLIRGQLRCDELGEGWRATPAVDRVWTGRLETPERPLTLVPPPNALTAR